MQQLKASERESSPRVPRILIVGGGIAGLTLAAALRRSDIESTIVEKVPRYSDVGYVIGLWPMGRRVLDRLDLGRRFGELTVPVNDYIVHADGGRRLRRFDFGNRLGDDVPQVLKRAELLDVLRSYHDGIEVRMACIVDEVQQTDQVVRVRFNDGESAEYDVVVGADGIGSRLRRLVAGEVSVRSTGLRLWSWWAPDIETDVVDAVHEFWGLRRFFAYNPTKGPLGCAAVLPANGAPATPAEMKTRLAGIAGSADWILDSLDKVPHLECFDLDDLWMTNWVFGRIVLIGDAAAAFLPSAAVGASMAMESAQVLAEELTGVDSAGIPGALQRYVRRRRARVDTIQGWSRSLAPFMVPRTWMGYLARNAALRVVPKRFVTDEITEWSHSGTTGHDTEFEKR
jgi:2-polyprenyl-6-methoxyphenol hydroxylase-like FAD-dependent oxidoreductase